MYADKHRVGLSMELSTMARENLAKLINSNDVKRISISGEGEPLNNIEVFHEILGLSDGGRSFEFITSGFLPHQKMVEFYETTDEIVSAKGDSCNIRLSSDSHHIQKVKWRAHGLSLDYLFRAKPRSLSFSFRSTDIDKQYTRKFLKEELANWGLDAIIEPSSVLEDKLFVGDRCFGIDYKNLVNPSIDTPSGYLDLFGYIQAIESKVNKRFTFGSLNTFPQANGLDITVKPDGGVYFYGIENHSLGNIHMNSFDWNRLIAGVYENELVRTLYTEPLLDLLTQFENNAPLRSIVSKVNNPYWIVKELSTHDGFLEKWGN
jgi:hypothetical protein